MADSSYTNQYKIYPFNHQAHLGRRRRKKTRAILKCVAIVVCCLRGLHAVDWESENHSRKNLKKGVTTRK